MQDEMPKVDCDLISAVRRGDLEISRQIIDSFGLSYWPSWENGYVLLIEALKHKHVAVAKLLLASGCEVNSKTNETNPAKTPLHRAVKNGDIEIVEMIIIKGAEIDAKNHWDETPVNWAIEYSKIEITELLLKRGPDVHYVSKTPSILEDLDLLEDLYSSEEEDADEV